MFQELEDGVTFAVKVIPRAAKDEVAGVDGDAQAQGLIKIRLKAAPVDGKANEALIAFLAKRLGVRKAQVEILRGTTTRNKVVRVRGVTAMRAQERLGNSPKDSSADLA